MECKNCFKDWISCGVKILRVLPLLQPTTDYTYILTSPQGAKYLKAFTTDAVGQFELEEPGTGLWNPYTGPWTLEIQSINCTEILFNDTAYCEPFFCIEFEIKNGDGIKNTLGCACPELS